MDAIDVVDLKTLRKKYIKKSEKQKFNFCDREGFAKFSTINL